MVKILDRYVVRELLPPFLMVVGGFVVLLVGDILYVLTEYLARGQVGLVTLLRLLYYKTPHILVFTFPVAMLFACLLGIGRLAKDGEITALRMTGLSHTRIFLPALTFALGVALATFGVNEYVMPPANRKADRLLRESVFRDAFPHIRQDVFFRGPGNRYFYIRRVDVAARTLHGVMIYELVTEPPRLITARQATLRDDGYWHLEDGVVRSLDADGFTTYEAGFKQFDIRVGPTETGLALQQQTADQMSSRDLRGQMRLLRQSGVDTQAMAVDYYFKFAAPGAALIFALLAAPLALQPVRSARLTGWAIAIVLIFVYYVIMSMSRAWGRAGALPPFLGAWMANLVFLAAAVLLYLRVEGRLARRRSPAVRLRRALPAEIA